MWRKQLGRTGVMIPEVGLGTWNYHGGPRPLGAGLDAGALFIDTAESYHTEEIVAGVLRGRRERVFVATKISPDHYHPAEVRRSAEASLSRLGTDYVDLYQLHYPTRRIPLGETLGAIEELIDAGKVRFAGVSNFSVGQLQAAIRAMRRHPIVSNQVRYNLVDRTIEPELLPFCRANGITVIAHTPLAKGFRRVLDGDPEGVLDSVSRECGRTPVQAALNWCLRHDEVVVIPKGNSTAHVTENCGASGWRLTAEQADLLDEKIRYRRRSRLESALRRGLPAPLVGGFRRLFSHLPKGWRRRLS